MVDILLGFGFKVFPAVFIGIKAFPASGFNKRCGDLVGV
jgi:hypothetical protein